MSEKYVYKFKFKYVETDSLIDEFDFDFLIDLGISKEYNADDTFFQNTGYYVGAPDDMYIVVVYYTKIKPFVAHNDYTKLTEIIKQFKRINKLNELVQNN